MGRRRESEIGREGMGDGRQWNEHRKHRLGVHVPACLPRQSMSADHPQAASQHHDSPRLASPRLPCFLSFFLCFPSTSAHRQALLSLPFPPTRCPRVDRLWSSFEAVGFADNTLDDFTTVTPPRCVCPSKDQVWEKVRVLEAAARSDLSQQGFKPEDVHCQAYLNLRFHGTDTALMTPASPPLHKASEPGGGGGGGGSGGGETNDGDALQSFFEQYRWVTFSYILFPCLALSYRVSSCLLMFCLVLSCLIVSRLVLSCLSCCLALPCLASTWC